MRNLYKKLGLTKNASKEQIIEKLRSIRNSRLQKDIQKILLNENNRRAYDELYDLLFQISLLRSKLGINYSDNWKGEVVDDFAPSKIVLDLKYEKFLSKINSSVREKQKSNAEINKSNSVPSFLKPVLIIIGIIIFFAIIKNANKDDEYKNIQSNPYSGYTTDAKENSEISDNAPDKSIGKPKPSYPFPVLPYPKHGTYKSTFKSKRIAPFQIKSESGGYYLLKLQNIHNANKFVTIFIQGGRNITLDIPLGEYLLKYAFGYKWYGYEHYFGEETAYSKADELFYFKIVGEQVSGYTVSLYNVIGGNLNTVNIEPEEF